MIKPQVEHSFLFTGLGQHSLSQALLVLRGMMVNFETFILQENVVQIR